MTVVPLPDTPCVRVRLDYNVGEAFTQGNRLYFSYSGSAPSSANCNTLAADVGSAWETNIAPLVSTQYALKEVDVQDIATHTGAFGQSTTGWAASRAGNPPTAAACTNIEFNIARRYRGGKPRIFLPAGVVGDEVSITTWGSSFLTAAASGWSAFIGAIEALSIGSMGTLAHVNLSYFQGFTNHTNTSGRTKPVPTYRATALHDVVTGYAVKPIIGSQRRRLRSTTP